VSEVLAPRLGCEEMTPTELIFASDTALTPFVDAMISSTDRLLGISEGERFLAGPITEPEAFPSEYVIHDFPAEVRR
jgi:hypothetical protein